MEIIKRIKARGDVPIDDAFIDVLSRLSSDTKRMDQQMYSGLARYVTPNSEPLVIPKTDEAWRPGAK